MAQMLEIRNRRKKLALRNEKQGDSGGGRDEAGGTGVGAHESRALLRKAGTFIGRICSWTPHAGVFAGTWVDGWKYKWEQGYMGVGGIDGG